MAIVNATTSPKNKTKFWVYKTSYYCPQCGKVKEYRERRYTDKPPNWHDRNEEIEAWDYCGI